MQRQGRGQKVKCHLISITKSISKIFILNFLCVLINERYKTYQTGFLACRLGHALRVGLGGAEGSKIIFCPVVCPLCYLLLNHWTKFNQTLGTWGWVKRSNIIKFQFQSQFQRFLYQTLCVFSQMKDTKHIRWDFILSPGSCPRGGT